MKKHKFNVGDLVTVNGNESGHNVEFGTKGSVVEVVFSNPAGESGYSVNIGCDTLDFWECDLDITEPEMSEVAKAKKTLEDAGYLGVYWQRIDVEGRADELGIELTDEQLDDVCETIVRRHDAEQGINWDVIDCHLQEYAADEDEDERVQAMWDEGYAQVMGDKE